MSNNFLVFFSRVTEYLTIMTSLKDYGTETLSVYMRNNRVAFEKQFQWNKVAYNFLQKTLIGLK